MITIRSERPADVAAREALLDVAYGPVRFTRPSQTLREGRAPALAFVALEQGRVVGSVRLWTVAAGPGRLALLLGPLAVDPGCRRRGIGAALMRRAIRAARAVGHGSVLLVGEEAYYGRFGFTAAKSAALRMPEPVPPHRLLGLELAAGALDGARGSIRAGDRLRPARPVAPAAAAARAA